MFETVIARCAESHGFAEALVAPSSVLAASGMVRLHFPVFLRHQSWCDICCGLAKPYFLVAEFGAKRRIQEHALHIYRCIYMYIYIFI